MKSLFFAMTLLWSVILLFLAFQIDTLERQIEDQSNIPASCYINTDKLIFCLDSEGHPITVTLYRSYTHTWDNYSRPEG